MGRSLPARVLAVLLAWQLFASILTVSRGFPYYGSSMVDNAPVWELPLALWHYPAIEILSASGYCCGLRNQLIFEAKVRGGHVTMKPFGAVVLAASSWAFWSMLVLLALVLRARLRAREQPLLEQPPDDEEPEGGRRGEPDDAGATSHEHLR